MREISFRKPDDWHVHFRDGAILKEVVGFTARQFGRAIVMPNLAPPITTAPLAAAYRQRIVDATPEDAAFTPLMTCYLTDDTDAADVVAGFHDGIWVAAKLYPAQATTNAHHGVTAMEKIYPVLEAMAGIGMPLLVHGELASGDIDIFDREGIFIDTILAPLVTRLPGLKIVMEHITTAGAVAFVRANSPRMGATITPQHLLYNRNALFAEGIRPHMYCLPILKREADRLALRSAATSGESCFFLGTDTAPHMRHLKEAPCGCAGIFSAPVATAAYLEVFAEERALQHFERFASLNGPAFYGMQPNEERVRYIEQPVPVMHSLRIAGGGEIVPLFAGEQAAWSAA